MAKRFAEQIAIGPEVTNAAAQDVDSLAPYTVTVGIVGVADILLHRWNNEAVAEKAVAAKGSKSKKSDNVESYVYRDGSGDICIPGEYLRQAIIHAAKYKQDPRSPRKSLMDLVKASVISLTPLASLGSKKWEFEDRRRVVIQRSAVTRVRPAFREGWQIEVEIMVNMPQYITPALLHELVTDAGRLIGIGDFRPTYGRFRVVEFKT